MLCTAGGRPHDLRKNCLGKPMWATVGWWSIFLRWLSFSRHVSDIFGALFQQYAINALQSKTEPISQLEAYVRACMRWPKDFQSILWFGCFIFTIALWMKGARLVIQIWLRLVSIELPAWLRSGSTRGSSSQKDPVKSAKLIQSIITGAIVTMMSEKALITPKEFQAGVIKICMGLVGNCNNRLI